MKFIIKLVIFVNLMCIDFASMALEKTNDPIEEIEINGGWTKIDEGRYQRMMEQLKRIYERGDYEAAKIAYSRMQFTRADVEKCMHDKEKLYENCATDLVSDLDTLGLACSGAALIISTWAKSVYLSTPIFGVLNYQCRKYEKIDKANAPQLCNDALTDSIEKNCFGSY
ncbi:MAG: hypothetical protein JKX90_07865 [Colwellia sp.]|nr:hypothetical protein [Colwellia sp.]